MDARRLLTFRAVARERSFSRAARSLALSQPSVSQQVAAIAGAERSTLLLGAFPTALASLVPRAVARLAARSPGARIVVEEGTTDVLTERVRSGALHLAVTFQDAAAPPRAPADLERRHLLRESFLVALAPDHRL